MFSGQFQVNIVLVIHHFFDGEILFHELLAALSEFFPQRGIIGKLQQPLRGGVRVAGADDEASFIVEADFIRAIEVVGDDWPAGGKRLWQRAGQRLAIRQMREAIHDADETCDFTGRHKASENDFAFETKLMNLPFNFVAQ